MIIFSDKGARRGRQKKELTLAIKSFSVDHGADPFLRFQPFGDVSNRFLAQVVGNKRRGSGNLSYPRAGRDFLGELSVNEALNWHLITLG